MAKMHPGLALIISGHLKGHGDGEEGDEKEPSAEEQQLDGMKAFIEAVHGKDPEEALACLKDLLELCKDEEPAEEEAGEPEEEEPSHSW